MSDYHEVGTFLSTGKRTADEPEREFLGIASAEPHAHLPLDVKIAGWSQWQPGEGVERQAASTFAIELVLDGKGQFRVDTARYDLRPGDVFFHHAGRHTVCRAHKDALFKKTFVVLWVQRPVLPALLKTLGLANVDHLR